MSVEAEKNGKAIVPDFAVEIFNAITHTHTQSDTDADTDSETKAEADTELAATATATAAAAANVLISPLLLESLLSLLYLGSDGVTAEELSQRLQLKRFSSNAKMANYYAAMLDAAIKDADTNVHLNSKLLLSAHLPIAQEFEKIALKYFHTTTERAAEAAASDGNAMAISMIELKFKWFLPFSAYRSGIYDFHMDAAIASEATSTPTTTETETATTTMITKPVAMLFDDDMFVKFGEFRELDARAIELPLEHELELAMLLLLPNQRDGLPALEQQLQQVQLGELVDRRMQMESVQVLLPKFQIDFECDVRRALEQLGIHSIFNEAANFKNLLQQNSTSEEHVQFSKILHKVRLQVNESGSEASEMLVHKPIVISNSIDARQKFFRADHPFYFAIRNGDATYFVGHVKTF